jgi:5-deoxy-glucuronate isomerase
MSRLLFPSRTIAPGRSGRLLEITPADARWEWIRFGIRQMARETTWQGSTRNEEACLVLLRGACRVEAGGQVYRVGPRPDVFSGYPYAMYLPPGTRFQITTEEETQLADGRAVSSVARARQLGLTPRLIGPEQCGYEIRGGGNATRQIVDIIRPDFPADRLLVCEVYTPSGNWSSYPPHKHDRDNPPREVDLEEIYYYRFGHPDGYGFQRLYGPKADRTLKVQDGDAVTVRDGYHPFVTAYGYDAYYLNVLAGTRRSMAASDDPRYAAFRASWPPPDPRLPLVAPPYRVG